MNFTHYDDLYIGNIYCEIEVDFDHWEGEPMVQYTYNGDGYPGSPPDVDITEVRVMYIDSKHWFRDRADMSGWEKDLDRMALEEIEDTLYNELVDTAEEYLEGRN
jgi:hypothetical protein